MVVNPYLLTIPTHGTTARGTLAVLELVPFPIRRVFYIYGVPGDTERGHHGHRNTTQLLTCIRGCVDVHIRNTNGDFHFVIDDPSKALVMPPDNFIIMKFHTDSVLLALADTLFSDDNVYR
jgi:hypothetical protein